MDSIEEKHPTGQRLDSFVSTTFHKTNTMNSLYFILHGPKVFFLCTKTSLTQASRGQGNYFELSGISS